MQGFRQHIFAGACFPGKQHGCIRGCQAGKQGGYPLYGRASAHKVAAAPCLLQALLQELYLGLVFNNIQVKERVPFFVDDREMGEAYGYFAPVQGENIGFQATEGREVGTAKLVYRNTGVCCPWP